MISLSVHIVLDRHIALSSSFAGGPGLEVRGMNACFATADSSEKLRASAVARGAMADALARRASSEGGCDRRTNIQEWVK